MLAGSNLSLVMFGMLNRLLILGEGSVRARCVLDLCPIRRVRHIQSIYSVDMSLRRPISKVVSFVSAMLGEIVKINGSATDS